jgi:DivIVA protein
MLNRSMREPFLTPVEIQHQRLRECDGGYERADVEALLERTVASYEQVWRERERLERRVAELEAEAVSQPRRRLDEAEAEHLELEAEVERLRMIKREMEATYRAFLLAALELLDGREREFVDAPSGGLGNGDVGPQDDGEWMHGVAATEKGD